MNLVHLSTSDINGGAARASHRLHRQLAHAGIESTMFVRNRSTDQDSVIQLNPDDSLFGQLRRGIRYARLRSAFYPWYTSHPRNTGRLSDDRTRFAGEVVHQLPSADILHLHYVSGFVDLPTFFDCVDRPIVWTLHDMNPITGGCHYSFGCRRFEQSCGRCPRIDSTTTNDPSRKSWRRKRTVFEKKISKSQLHIAAPSRWLAREARKSTLLGEAPIHRIPNGVDHTLFRPRCVQQEQTTLDIPSSQKVVLFVAHSSTDPRKGLDLLVKALTNAELTDVTFVSIGSDSPTVPDGISHVHAGHIDDDERLSALYSMADIFVIPSRQDNLPNTVLESMACGTPVVGFDTGGIPDMVRPNETGWLVETENVPELRRAIRKALENDVERKRMAERCRQVVKKEYTIERQAQQYKTLYTSVLEESTRN